MRKLQASWTLVVLSLCLLCQATGCDGSAQATLPNELLPRLDDGGFALPLPSALKAASAEQFVLSGSEYADGWPHNRAARVGGLGRFTPDYSNGRDLLDAAAYALYPFDVAGYTGDPVLHCYFADTGTQYSGWVGLPDYAKDRWDWVALPDPVEQHSQLELELAGRDLAGVMPVALVFLGHERWDVSSIHLGLTAAPGDWPMAGHDLQHTHRTASLGPATGDLLWRFHSTGPAQFPWSLGTNAEGNVYFGAGNTMVAYDEWGASLWECYDVTPNTLPTFDENGVLYVGGRWPDNGLHAINPNGTQRWVFWTDDQVLSQPAVTPAGNIVFGCNNGKLYCVRPNGTQMWVLPTEGLINCGPGIRSDGVIVASSNGGSLEDPFVQIFAVSPEGEYLSAYELLEDNPKPALGRISVAADNSAYVTYGKGEALVAYNADGSIRWHVSGGISQYSWPTVSPGNDIYAGVADGLDAYSSEGTLLWHAELGAEVHGGPQLLTDGRIACNMDDGSMALVDTAGNVEWQLNFGEGFWISPAAGDGVCYGANLDGIIYAVNADGTERWRQGAGRPVLASPVVASDGSVYFGCDDTYLYALWPDGAMKWRFETGDGITASPLLAPDGTLYVGSKDGYIYAVTPSGTLKWKYETRNLVECSPVLDAQGRILCGSNDGNLYCLNPDGSLSWKFFTTWKVTTSPAIDTDGKVYFGSWDYNVYCLDSAGELVWLYRTVGPVKGSVAINETQVFCTCEDNTMTGVVYALDKATGDKDWSYTSGGPMQMGPGLGPDGTVYAASNLSEIGTGGTIYAVNDDRLQWSYPGPNVSLGIAIDGNGVVYAGSHTGKVLALKKIDNVLTKLWEYSEPGTQFYTPALANGTIYIGYDHGLCAIGVE